MGDEKRTKNFVTESLYLLVMGLFLWPDSPLAEEEPSPDHEIPNLPASNHIQFGGDNCSADIFDRLHEGVRLPVAVAAFRNPESDAAKRLESIGGKVVSTRNLTIISNLAYRPVCAHIVELDGGSIAKGVVEHLMLDPADKSKDARSADLRLEWQPIHRNHGASAQSTGLRLTLNGRPIIGADANAHFSRTGVLNSVVVPNVSPDALKVLANTSYLVTPRKASEIAKGALEPDKKWTMPTEPVAAFLRLSENNIRSTWSINFVAREESRELNARVLVDSQNGSILSVTKPSVTVARVESEVPATGTGWRLHGDPQTRTFTNTCPSFSGKCRMEQTVPAAKNSTVKLKFFVKDNNTQPRPVQSDKERLAQYNLNGVLSRDAQKVVQSGVDASFFLPKIIELFGAYNHCLQQKKSGNSTKCGDVNVNIDPRNRTAQWKNNEIWIGISNSGSAAAYPAILAHEYVHGLVRTNSENFSSCSSNNHEWASIDEGMADIIGSLASIKIFGFHRAKKLRPLHYFGKNILANPRRLNKVDTKNGAVYKLPTPYPDVPCNESGHSRDVYNHSLIISHPYALLAELDRDVWKKSLSASDQEYKKVFDAVKSHDKWNSRLLSVYLHTLNEIIGFCGDSGQACPLTFCDIATLVKSRLQSEYIFTYKLIKKFAENAFAQTGLTHQHCEAPG